MGNRTSSKKYEMGVISIITSVIALILFIFVLINILRSIPQIAREPSAGYLVFEMNVRNLVLLFLITLVSLVGIFACVIGLIKKNTTLLIKVGLIINSLSIIFVLIYIFFGDWINKFLLYLY